MWIDEVVLAEAYKEIGFAYSAVADDEQFDQVVVTLLSFH